MDKYYGNVCELDIIFNFQKAYFILDELLLAGEMQESSKKNVLRCISQQDSLEDMEVSPPGLGSLSFTRSPDTDIPLPLSWGHAPLPGARGLMLSGPGRGRCGHQDHVVTADGVILTAVSCFFFSGVATCCFSILYLMRYTDNTTLCHDSGH